MAIRTLSDSIRRDTQRHKHKLLQTRAANLRKKLARLRSRENTLAGELDAVERQLVSIENLDLFDDQPV